MRQAAATAFSATIRFQTLPALRREQPSSRAFSMNSVRVSCFRSGEAAMTLANQRSARPAPAAVGRGKVLAACVGRAAVRSCRAWASSAAASASTKLGSPKSNRNSPLATTSGPRLARSEAEFCDSGIYESNALARAMHYVPIKRNLFRVSLAL